MKIASLLATTFCLLFVTQARADSIELHFSRPNTDPQFNNESDMVTAESQIVATLTDLGDLNNDGYNHVAFRFENLGPNASSLTQILFEGGDSLINPFITYHLGASFTETSDVNRSAHFPFLDLTAPYHLFETTAEPSSPGVDPNEWVEIDFELQIDKAFSDVLAALDLGLNQGYIPSEGSGGLETLRIGIFVQDFGSTLDNPGSESLINSASVPAPSSIIALLGLLSMGVVLRLRRRD